MNEQELSLVEVKDRIIARLTDTIALQTEMIDGLIAQLAEKETPHDEDAPETYMDGTPRR